MNKKNHINNNQKAIAKKKKKKCANIFWPDILPFFSKSADPRSKSHA